MGTEGGESSTVPDDVQQLVNKLCKLCKKPSVAEKESKQLLDLCNDLIRRLGDRPPTPQQHKYDDIRSKLADVEGRLEGRPGFISPKRFSMHKSSSSLPPPIGPEVEESGIKLSLAECIEKLSSAISRQEVQQLVDKIHKHCKKIAASKVAEEESSRLADLSSDLIKRPGDRSLTPQPSKYENIKRNLSVVEGRLEGWSKLKPPKMLKEKATIESGITECIKQLDSAISQREGAGEEVAVVVTDNKVLTDEPLPIHPANHGTREGQSEVSAVKRLDGEVVREGDRGFGYGAYYEVWEGQWKKGGGEVERVALKVLKPSKDLEKALKRLERELPSWAKLHHENVLPFYGIVTDIKPYLYMVSPWQENGDLLTYVKNNPEPKKNHLLRGAANGLSFLHSCGIVHGDVKCRNVLISRERKPLICDFAITNIVEENMSTKTVPSGDGVRYRAIELIEHANDDGVPATMDSDTYSFAMLILECITEKVPFSDISREAAVLHARVSKRRTPPRPGTQNSKGSISDGLWDLMVRCWSPKPGDRPTMGFVARHFLDNVN